MIDKSGGGFVGGMSPAERKVHYKRQDTFRQIAASNRGSKQGTFGKIKQMKRNNLKNKGI